MRWFEHGAETFLGEVAGPHELFLLSECNDNSLRSIACKIEVEHLGKDQSKGRTGLGPVEDTIRDPNQYFYRLGYNSVTRTFADPVELSSESTTDLLPNFCHCCSWSSKSQEVEKVRVIGSSEAIDGLRRGGVEYHLLDFVYILDEKQGGEQVYDIGQITRIFLVGRAHFGGHLSSETLEEDLRVNVELFKRYDDLLPSSLEEIKEGRLPQARDERRLFMQNKTSKIKVDALDGKCRVRHRHHVANLDDYKNEEDAFWVTEKRPTSLLGVARICAEQLEPLPPEQMQYSEKTLHEDANHEEKKAAFVQDGKALRGLVSDLSARKLIFLSLYHGGDLCGWWRPLRWNADDRCCSGSLGCRNRSRSGKDFSDESSKRDGVYSRR